MWHGGWESELVQAGGILVPRRGPCRQQDGCGCQGTRSLLAFEIKAIEGVALSCLPDS